MRHLIKQVCRLNDFAALRLSQFYAELRAYVIAVGCAAKGSFFNYVDQMLTIIDHLPKGQLNSEWFYQVIVSPEMPTKNLKDFCLTL